MKKRIGTLLALVLAIVLPFAGCGGGGGSSSSDVDDLIGTWVWSKLVVKGITLDDSDQGFHSGGSTTITPTMEGLNIRMTVTFNEDKSFVATTNGTGPGADPVANVTRGTWSVSGDVLTITASSEGESGFGSGVFSVSGSTLTIALSNDQLLDILSDNQADLSQLTAEQQTLLRGLSGTMEFTR